VVALDAVLPDLYSYDMKKKNWDLLAQLENAPKRLLVDLRNRLDSEQFSEFEYIFHLAAMPGLSLSWQNTKLYLDCNVLGTSNLLQACNPVSLKKFIYVSTSSVYGKSIEGDESTPTSPISPYGVSKLAAENLICAYAAASGMPFTIMRPFSVYGPRQRQDMAFNIFIRKILNGDTIEVYGDGSQSRTNTFISDLVNGLILGIQGAVSGETYNLAGNREYNVIEVISILEELIGRSAKVNFIKERLGDQRKTYNDSSKARIDFNYSPQTTLEEGLLKQIQWQIANP
jgi:UDP-glucuronate 4-epimerase